MKNPVRAGIIAALAFAAVTVFSAGSALAACAYSEWSNTQPGHPVATMTGRNCNGQHALKAVGADGFDFGWTPMTVTGINSFSATFVGNEASNDVDLTVHPLIQTMNVKITTNYNTGISKTWGANFKLDSIH